MKILAAQRLLSLIVIADWWSELDKSQQDLYIEQHPKSKKAKDAINKVSIVPSKGLTGSFAHKVIMHKFTKEQAKTIREYSSDATDPKNGRFSPVYSVLNKSLRTGDESKVDKRTKDIKKALDATFAQPAAEVKEPINVFRGVSDSFLKQLSVGSSFKDNGFVSTSTDMKAASNFSNDKDKTVMSIKVPKGAKALSIQQLSEYDEEQEILLNRGGTYKITNIDKDSKTGMQIIHVEYTYD